MVRLSIATGTVRAAVTVKTCEALLPETASEPAPGPVIVRPTAPVTGSAPLVRVIVPVTPGAKVIVSAPSVFTAAIASRSVAH